MMMMMMICLYTDTQGGMAIDHTCTYKVFLCFGTYYHGSSRGLLG